MAGLVCLVTGATAGLGKAIALEFARREATVVIVARSEERGARTLDEIAGSTGNRDVHLLVADLSSQASIRDLSEDFTRRFDHLDVLVNDAAVFARSRTVTAEGFELMFATNQLAPFALTLLLLPTLRTGSPARIINVTAPSTTRPDFTDLQGERRFRPLRAFGASKAANLLFTFALSRRLSGSGVTVNAYHPGLMRTSLMREAAAPIRILASVFSALARTTPERAAGEIAELAASPAFGEISGKLIHRGRSLRSPFEDDLPLQEQLFAACEELTGVHFVL